MRTSDLLHHRDDTQDRQGATDLFDGRSGDYRQRWTDIQTRFVDEPQHAVEQADGLVAEVITALAERFSTERARLEQRWHAGDVSTEELRVTLQHYRDFFQRLLDTPGTGPDGAASAAPPPIDRDVEPDVDREPPPTEV